MEVYYHEDDFCCEELDKVAEFELVDTYGGFTYQDTYVCHKCKRAFREYDGGRFEGIKEVDYKETIEEYGK